MSTTPASERVPVRTKAAYGLGTLAFGIKGQGFDTLLMLYYNQVIGLPAAWVGAAILIAMMADAISDPLIGHYSDNLRSRWGRRHPFMYASALPLAIGYMLLWTPPDASHMIQFVYLLVVAVLVRIAIACYEIPASTLIVEFTSDYNERTSISTYKSLFHLIGVVGMTYLTLKVFLKATPENPVGQLGAAGYVQYGQYAAALMLVSVLIASLGTHDRIPTLKQNTGKEHAGLKELWTGLKAILRDRTIASVLFCILFFGVGSNFISSAGIYVSTYFWHLNAEHLATIAGSTVWGLALGLIVVQLAKKFSKKRVAITMYSIATAAVAVPPILGLTGLIPMDISVILPWLIGKHILLTMSVVVAIIMGASMGADAAEHLQLKTGRRSEGLIFAAVTMVSKAVSGVGIFISGMVLTAIEFPAKATPETVTPEIAHKLTLVFVGGGTALFILAIIALSFYPITRESHERTLRALKEREEALKQPVIDVS